MASNKNRRWPPRRRQGFRAGWRAEAETGNQVGAPESLSLSLPLSFTATLNFHLCLETPRINSFRYPDGSVLVDTRVLHTRIIMIQHLDYYYPSEGPVHSCCRVHVRVEAPRERQIALEIERRKASQAAAMRSLQASSVSTSSRSNPEAGPVQGPRRDPLQSTSRAEPATEEVQDTEAAGVQASAPHGSIKGIRAASESASSNEPGPESEQAADATTPREGASDLGGVDKDVPRLTGRWTVDETRSDPLEPFLKEIGVPWLLRKPICGLKVRLIPFTPRPSLSNARLQFACPSLVLSPGDDDL